MNQGIVLVLGGGGARGLAHIGVLEVLEEAGIPIRAVVGTSVGAEVGGFYAAGVGIDEMRRISCEMDWISTMRLFTPDFSEGAISNGKYVRQFLEPYLGGRSIEELPVDFAAIAADIVTGREVVMRTGSLLEAVRASLSVPGLLSPQRIGSMLLVDGGVVNPVPFDVAREFYGGPVIAVDVHALPEAQKLEEKNPEWEEKLQELLDTRLFRYWPVVGEWLQGFRDARSRSQELKNMGLSAIVYRSQMISEDMLVQLRCRHSPPDVMLLPDVQRIGTLEFYRGREALDAGRAVARDYLEAIRDTLKPDYRRPPIPLFGRELPAP